MINLSKYIPLVKSMLDETIQSMRQATGDQSKALFSKQETLKALIDDIEKADKELAALSDPQYRINNAVKGVSPEDLANLPAEVLEQLGISKCDKKESKIQDIIRKKGGIASLDQIIVEWYKETNQVFSRVRLSAKLYRMSQKEMIFSVPSRKGLYSLQKPAAAK